MSKIIKYVCMQEAPILIDHNFIVDGAQIDTPLVNELMSSANREVATIIEKAKKTAELCLDEANQQIAPIKQQAYDEGHQKGYQEGHQEGIIKGQQAGLVEMQQVIDQAIVKTQQMLTTGEQGAKQMILAAEEQII